VSATRLAGSHLPWRLRRIGTVLAGSALALALTATALVSPAHADTPQERAVALASKVRVLQQQAEAASEQYDAAESQLGLVVTEASLSEQAADAAHAADRADSAAADQRARELYMLGGPGPLYVQVIAHGSDLAELQTGMVATRNVVELSRSAASAAVARSKAADAADARAAKLAETETTLEAEVQAKADDIRNTLAQTQQALDSANAEVRELAAQAEAAQAAADSAGFDSALAAAILANGGSAAGAPSPLAARALAAAMALQGKPYQWGGNGPNSYDCSGMTKAAYAAAGLQLPRTAAEQYLTGPHPGLADLRPGDLLFWASDPSNTATIDHVAIYAGNSEMVSADHTGDVVRLQPVWWSGFAGATRPGPTD
jgi:cell wall-associated NlpC family hydrolase